MTIEAYRTYLHFIDPWAVYTQIHRHTNILALPYTSLAHAHRGIINPGYSNRSVCLSVYSESTHLNAILAPWIASTQQGSTVVFMLKCRCRIKAKKLKSLNLHIGLDVHAALMRGCRLTKPQINANGLHFSTLVILSSNYCISVTHVVILNFKLLAYLTITVNHFLLVCVC